MTLSLGQVGKVVPGTSFWTLALSLTDDKGRPATIIQSPECFHHP